MSTEFTTWTLNFETLPALTLATAPPVAGRQSEGAPAVGGDGSAPVGQAAPAPFGGGLLFPLLFALMLFLIVSSVLGGRKEKKRRATMLGSIKRHDRIQTVGGVIGTVAEVRDDEIVVKVDETTNTKIRFARSAVQQIIKPAAGSGEPAGDPARPEKIGV